MAACRIALRSPGFSLARAPPAPSLNTIQSSKTLYRAGIIDAPSRRLYHSTSYRPPETGMGLAWLMPGIFFLIFQTVVRRSNLDAPP
jgi:hypothetical protein